MCPQCEEQHSKLSQDDFQRTATCHAPFLQSERDAGRVSKKKFSNKYGNEDSFMVTTFTQLPPVLVFQLKRSNNNLRKDQTEVSFHIHLKVNQKNNGST